MQCSIVISDFSYFSPIYLFFNFLSMEKLGIFFLINPAYALPCGFALASTFHDIECMISNIDRFSYI